MPEIEIPASQVFPASMVTQDGVTYFLAQMHTSGARCLGVLGDMTGFAETTACEGSVTAYPLSAHNAAELRRRLPWLNPAPLGMRASFGFGDRIGLATPGHIQALRACGQDTCIVPIFAQQSVRENTRIGRTPQQVLDDAMWGVFQEGWRAPWGADADHIKELEDVPAFAAAGYTSFTIDPSDHVDNAAQSDSSARLRAKSAALPWGVMQSSYADMLARYCREPFELEGLSLRFAESVLLRALAKYGHALAHAIKISQAVGAQIGARGFDLEMSVDETDTPTSAHEHFFIANELRRCQVPVTSLAPRFVGKFQKGVDYIGDLAEFERELVMHAAIVHHFGSYKLSIHTGSDKFSLYPIIARHTRRLMHVKTAGTSYLEALRVAAQVEPGLLRAILDLAHDRFAEERHTYYLDCRPENVPHSAELTDAELPGLLADFDARQLLHVTFGSTLDRYGALLQECLNNHAGEYIAALVAHFRRHLIPLL